MKLLLPLLFCLSLIGQTRDKAPVGFYDGYTGFALPAEPVLPDKEVHPSLWFKAGDLPALQKNFTADDFARSRWVAVQKLADLAKPLPPPPAATDKTEGIHKYYGAMSIATRAHAFMALFADDAAARDAHRKRAELLLLRAYDGPIYELDPKVQSGPVDEIYRGSWLQNYAHAYDCIQSALSPDIDQQIRARLAREAQCVYENLYDWTPGSRTDKGSPHNHLSKPAWGLGSIALTLSNDPRAKAWLGRAIEAANKNTRYFFSGDGIYREGSHYLVFSLTNFVPFLYHYRNVSGVDGFAAFQPVFEMMVAVRNSRGWLPNIEDSYIRPTPTHLAAVAYRHALTKLHATAPLAEILTWSYATCDLAPFSPTFSASGYNYTGASLDYSLEFDELLTHDATLRATVPDAAPNIFLAGGQTIFRNAWAAAGPGQRYLLFHGVAPADNHNHDDQLSFILQAEDQMMCSDGGYSRGTYTGAERTAWYSKAAAHNTLTFDGQPADKDATNATPPVTFRLDQPGLAGEEKTAFFGQKATWHRAIFWIAGDFYVVVDRVAVKQAGEIKAYLHGGRGTLTTDGPRRTWSYAADRYGPAAKLHTWIAAPEAVVTAKQGELTYIKEDYAEFPYLETTRTNISLPWLTLLKPTAGELSDFTVRSLATGQHTVFVINSGSERTVVAAGDRALLTVEGIESDAEIVVVRRDATGKILNQFAHGGTYLRVDGKTLSP